MALIARDLMVGNPRLAELGFGEEAMGRNAIARRLPGPAPVDRPLPQRRLPGGDPQLLLRLERHPRPAHRRDRERLAERRDDALDAPAHEPGADLRRRAHLLEPGRGRAGHRLPARRPRGGRVHPPDQLRRGHAGRHGRDDRRAGAPGHEAVLGDQRRGRGSGLEATTWYPANRGYFRGGGFSSQFVSRGGMPVTMARINLVTGPGPVLQIAEGWTVDLPRRSTTSWTSAPTPPGRPTGSCPARPAAARSATSTR